MLSRCKSKSTGRCVRCIAIIAAPSFPRLTLTAEKLKKHEDEVWDSVLKAIPTSSSWRTRPRLRQRNTLRPDFFSSSRSMGQSRKYTTEASQGQSQEQAASSQRPSPDEPGSLFDASQDAWDHVFDNIDELPRLSDMPVTPRLRSTVHAPTTRPARPQTMTARELATFEGMFDMIFTAALHGDKPPSSTSASTLTPKENDKRPRTAADRRADRLARQPDPLSGVGIGSGPEGATTAGITDLFGKLRRVSRAYRWSPAEDAELERKLEQIELCETDVQLLEWAVREVFEESSRYEGAARQAVVRAEAKARGASPPESTLDTNQVLDPESAAAPISPLPLQPPAYPHLLAALMRTFRDKFHDPHLALSIFTHARSLSIASSVFGCTAPVYTELLTTRWRAFADLRGVADALEEMRVNGVVPDAKTRTLVEEIRREVGARTVWAEERNIGTGEVLELLTRIETLSREPTKEERGERQRQRKKSGKRKEKKWRTSTAERWKAGEDGGKYKFGDWNFKQSSARKPMRNGYDHEASRSEEAERLSYE